MANNDESPKDEIWTDPIEERQIDKFVCDEVGRQIHRYIKAMSGSKTTMLKFEERLSSMTPQEKEHAIALYIDLNRKVLSGLDWKIVLTRAMANYCDTFSYMLQMLNYMRRWLYYKIPRGIRGEREIWHQGCRWQHTAFCPVRLPPHSIRLRRRPAHHANHCAEERQDGACSSRPQGHRCGRLHLRQHLAA